jgi:hypothetical protein
MSSYLYEERGCSVYQDTDYDRLGVLLRSKWGQVDSPHKSLVTDAHLEAGTGLGIKHPLSVRSAALQWYAAVGEREEPKVVEQAVNKYIKGDVVRMRRPKDPTGMLAWGHQSYVVYGGEKLEEGFQYTLLVVNNGTGTKTFGPVKEEDLTKAIDSEGLWLDVINRYDTLQERNVIVADEELMAVDFEFSRVSEKFVNPISVAYQAFKGKARSVWLKEDAKEKKDYLEMFIQAFLKDEMILLCFSAPAELRSLRALGFTKSMLRKVRVIDLYVEWKQCKFNNDDWNYGSFFKNGREIISVAPSFNKEENLHNNNTALGDGLVDCVARLFHIDMNTAHKKEMRQLCIDDKDYYDPEEIQAILDYGGGDIKYLFDIWAEFQRFMKEDVGYNYYPEAALNRGRFMIEVALMEEVGMPLDLVSAANLCKNNTQAKEDLIGSLVDEYGDFYVRKAGEVGALKGEWKKNYSHVADFIESHGLADIWPKTDHKDPKKRLFSTKEETFKEYGDGYPELKRYRQVMKNVSHINYFRPEGYDTILQHIGDDGMLRAFLRPFGAQTGRSQPKPSHGFVPAMSNWLRCLIQAPEGYGIIAGDYSAQEFGIAGVMSQDQNMLHAYRSGDPYATFAKLTGSIPPDADLARIKKPGDDELYMRYSASRTLFKAIVLGQQFGMGAALLAVKVTADTGIFCSVGQAEEYIQMHKDTFSDYWEYAYAIGRTYDYDKYLSLHDGWLLLGDNRKALSVRNFPIQGTAACMMREACVLAGDAGCELIFTLHDALYTIAPLDRIEEHRKMLEDAMQQAVVNTIGTTLEMRIDMDIHEHGHVWIEDKGEKDYAILSKWLKQQKDWKELEDSYMNKLGLVMPGYTSPII